MSRRHLRLLRDCLLALGVGFLIVQGGGKLLPETTPFPLWLGAQALLFCLAGVAVVTLMQAHLIFAPSEFPRDQPLPIPPDSQELWLEPGIHALWFPKPGASEALLYCHGNAGDLSHRIVSANTLRRELEVSVLAIDYPGFGKSRGAPTEASCYASALAGLTWLTSTQGFPLEQTLVLGKSLGGGVATEVALRHPTLKALILSRTFCSIPDMGRRLFRLRLGPLVFHRFDNQAKLPKVSVPVLLLFGSDDTLCPPVLGEALLAAANEPKRLVVLEGDQHNTPSDSRYYAAIREWLTKF
ncbi:alpha/beta hydrolase [Armatimonas rosea]|uniref:AB hydrolase-1 domain-containing protein n=1 Tax=Armatimonas rosea TaxID=685828 RepID=A0A7W9STE7_ARMRO|nr:alpha/beta hydrolase [Armatimonas rosea]MBB6051879.1 hypothetical protein [Armatimonas rosea]